MDGKERADVMAYYEKATVCAKFLPPPGDVEMTKAAWMILGLLQDSERAERYRKALERIEREPCSESRHDCYDPMHIHCCSDMRVIAVAALRGPTHATEH